MRSAHCQSDTIAGPRHAGRIPEKAKGRIRPVFMENGSDPGLFPEIQRVAGIREVPPAALCSGLGNTDPGAPRPDLGWVREVYK